MVASILGTDIYTGQRVTLEQEKRLGGMYVIGKTGSGKTTLLINLILQDIEQGMGLCFFDTHGDAIERILERLPQDRERDVIFLDLLDNDSAFGLNLFQCKDHDNKQEVSRVVSMVMGVFAKLFTESGDLLKEAPNMARTLQYVVPVLLASTHPHMTMAEIPLLLDDEVARMKLLAPLHNPMVQAFWTSYDRWRFEKQQELVNSTLGRVGNFLTDPLILEIVGQSETTLDFRKIMDERKILLVKLSRQHELITSLVGSVIVGQIANAAFSRSDTPEDRRVQFNLYADEYQRFSTPTFAELLAEVRKFKIATCVAHQWRGQLDQANRGATLNAANMVVYQVSGEDAEELAKQFDHTPPAPDIIGQRPIYSPKRDVVDHLVKTGHKNQMVNSFASHYVVPLTDLLRQYANKGTIDWMDQTSFFEESYLAVDDLREGINELNNTLYACMVDHDAYKLISPYTLLAASFCFKFSQGVGLGMKLIGNGYNVELKHRFNPKQITLDFCQPNVFSHLENLKSQISKKEKFNQAIAFLRSLRSAMDVLAVDPILVDTGQHEPIYDKPRTYADVQNEIATRLANPKEFTASCKLGSREYTIQALPFRAPDGEPVVQARRERIIQQTRDLFCKKREEVEHEIASRQAVLLKPVQKKPRAKQEEDEE